MQYGFWRDDLLEGERYNEDLTMWGQEDTEMAYRLIHSGVKKKFLKMGGVQYPYPCIIQKLRRTIDVSQHGFEKGNYSTHGMVYQRNK